MWRTDTTLRVIKDILSLCYISFVLCFFSPKILDELSVNSASIYRFCEHDIIFFALNIANSYTLVHYSKNCFVWKVLCVKFALNVQDYTKIVGICDANLCGLIFSYMVHLLLLLIFRLNYIVWNKNVNALLTD